MSTLVEVLARPCAHYREGHGFCGETPTRAYIVGPRCAAHTPARLAGRPETVPAPASTMKGLRNAAFVERRKAEIRREQAALGWVIAEPAVASTGLECRPGERVRVKVNHAKVHRAQKAVGQQLQREAQIRRVDARERAG